MIDISNPVNARLVKGDDPNFKRMRPVTVGDIHDTSTNDFHEEGFYSKTIFGDVGTRERYLSESHIKLNVKILDPTFFHVLVSLKSIYKGIIEGKVYATWNDKLKDFEKSDVIYGETGYKFFVSHLHEIVFKKTRSPQRRDKLEFIAKYINNCYISNYVVIGAGLRDYEVKADGRPTEHEITKIYRKILNSANAIPEGNRRNSDYVSDAIRWNIQKHVNEAYIFIIDMVKGDSGAFQSKYMKRRITNTTRNVISASDAAGDHAHSPRIPDIDQATVGLLQFAVSTIPLFSNAIFTTFGKPIYDDPNSEISLFDKNTLKPIKTKLSQGEKDKWSTSDGVTKMIGSFFKPEIRDKPVTIDGHYLAMVYKDKESIRVFVPEDLSIERFDLDNIEPMTWAELFYLCIDTYKDRVRAFTTRYPVKDIGSTFAVKPYLKTTLKTQRLTVLDPSMEKTDKEYLEYPVKGKKYLETMSPHTVNLPELGADFDGDKMSFLAFWSDEAVAEADKILNSINFYLNPDGGLRYSFGNDTVNMILPNFF